MSYSIKIVGYESHPKVRHFNTCSCVANLFTKTVATLCQQQRLEVRAGKFDVFSFTHAYTTLHYQFVNDHTLQHIILHNPHHTPRSQTLHSRPMWSATPNHGTKGDVFEVVAKKQFELINIWIQHHWKRVDLFTHAHVHPPADGRSQYTIQWHLGCHFAHQAGTSFCWTSPNFPFIHSHEQVCLTIQMSVGPSRWIDQLQR
jgi:hypothetical protein